MLSVNNVTNYPNPHPGDFHAGLENIVAAQTRLSRVEGERGELTIAGFAVEEIAPRATFEEMVHLLWYDTLPNRDQLAEFRARLAAEWTLSAVELNVLRAAAVRRIPTMDALRMSAGTLDPRSSNEVAILGRLPTMVATYVHLLEGQEPIEPHADLGHAANYLYMLLGREPYAQETRALETYLNAVMDHGLNASTFAARVIISTDTDLVSAVVGALGALKGPLHGGAPGPALDMVFDIGEESRAEAYLRAKLDRGERLMGFGHRVYRARDPRADVLGTAADLLYREAGDMALYRLAKSVEQTALQLLAEYHPERKLQTNVEFYTALLLHGLGFPTDLFTPTFAISRAAGWLAHCQEQREQKRLIRPQSEYVGASGRQWIPLPAR